MIDNASRSAAKTSRRARSKRASCVDVRVNGRGPYRFVVDSGADTSVVGLRIARDLQLPLGTPAILNGMTARSIVDRVMVDQLTLGAEHRQQPRASRLREATLAATA